MKRITLISLYILGIIFLAQLTNAQSFSLDFTTDIIEITSESGVSYNVDVVVHGSSPVYTVMLFDEDPLKGPEPIQVAEDINQDTITLQGLRKGKYHICVFDADENMDCKKIEI